jgi:hypothetical protein
MARSLEDMMRVISALIAHADNEGNSEEARATYRAKAENLMREYRIEEENLIATDQFSIMPILVKVDVSSLASHFRHYHDAIWSRVATHCGIRSVLRYDSEKRGYVAQAVGYDADLRYAQFLFQSAKLMMIAKLEPEVDPNLSDKENIYRLRSAGIDRQRIAEMVWGKQGHQEGLRVGNLYKEACADRGEIAAVSGRTVNAKTYREAYANAFLDQLTHRLWEARNAADSTGGTLDLHGRQERVDEAFYTHFPQYRPQPRAEETVTEQPKRRGRAVKSWTQADEARYQRLHNSPAAVRATAAGRQAADAVQITRTARTGRVDSTSEPSNRQLES